jgi:hypothetical protein
MSEPAEELFPQTQPSFSGRPPRPPKITARGLEDWGDDDPEKVIHIPDPVVVRDLAAALKLKPFKVVADLMRLRLFKTPDEHISFEIAEIVAQWHGHKAIQTFLC